MSDDPVISPSSSKSKKWKSIAINGLLMLLIYIGFQYWQERNALSGEAPVFVGKLLTGENISLAAYRGKPVLVHFWASWCPICRFEQGNIDSLSRDYAVLTIAAQSGSREEVAEYVAEQGITAPVLVDEYGDIAAMYSVRGYPSSFIIDEQGQIYDQEIGFTSEWGLRLRLKMLAFFQ